MFCGIENYCGSLLYNISEAYCYVFDEFFSLGLVYEVTLLGGLTVWSGLLFAPMI
jgi:hypothetical protein